MDVVQVSPDIAYCEQPTFQQLRELRRQGFKTLVNVRLPNEQRADERIDAERVGFRYVQLPIAQRDWSEAVFDQLRGLVERHRALPMLVHSAEGARAGVLALTLHGAEQSWTVEQLVSAARQLGLGIPGAARDWLRQHSGAYDAQPGSSPRGL